MSPRASTPAAKPARKTAAKSGRKASTKSSGRTAAKSAGRTATKASGRKTAKSPGTTTSTSAGRSPAKSAAKSTTKPASDLRGAKIEIPRHGDAELVVGGRTVRLTNLHKPFWKAEGITKGMLLQYYADVAPALLPHLRDRAMVMKRYPNGAEGKCFFMKRAPEPRPEWIETCAIEHKSGSVIDFPMIQDLASLLWVVNLGCIDLNQWYGRCDDVDRPDYLTMDLDPVPGASFATVREAALIVRRALEALGMKPLVKTTGSKGVHVYVPIVRGPTQKEVWTFAKAFAQTLAAQFPKTLTAEYKVAKRPRGRVLVDYNQNAWGRTLASLYSPRPKPGATVSTPVTWEEIEQGIEIGDFTVANVPTRVRRVGDLWKPLLAARGRFDLATLV